MEEFGVFSFNMMSVIILIIGAIVAVLLQKANEKKAYKITELETRVDKLTTARDTAEFKLKGYAERSDEMYKKMKSLEKEKSDLQSKLAKCQNENAKASKKN